MNNIEYRGNLLQAVMIAKAAQVDAVYIWKKSSYTKNCLRLKQPVTGIILLKDYQMK